MLTEIALPIPNVRAVYTEKPLDLCANPQEILNNKLVYLNQVHGCDVANITTLPKKPPTADASFTAMLNLGLVVKTADCLPILLSTTSGSIIAAIHAGWRSLQQGIIKNTLIAMNVSEPLVAWLGPCICEKCFEVGPEVYTLFNSQSQNKQKYHLNLKTLARDQLIQLNVKQIISSPSCTACEPEHFFSHRRNKDLGRMGCIIIKNG